MKVRDLIAELQKCNPEHEVIIGKDREGNEHSPCAGAVLGMYVPESTWRGEWHSTEHRVEDGGCTKQQVNAVCLYPVD